MTRFFFHEHQSVVVSKALAYFSTHSIGKIYWACGTGKTLASIMIAHVLICQTVLVGVLSRFLLNRFRNAILKIFPSNTTYSFCWKD
jgi:predicted helicase